MDNEDLVRAWKDPDSRADLPGIAHPAGDIDLTALTGGDLQHRTELIFTMGCCGGLTALGCTFTITPNLTVCQLQQTIGKGCW